MPPASKVTPFPMNAYVSHSFFFLGSKISIAGGKSLPAHTARRSSHQSFSSDFLSKTLGVKFFQLCFSIISTIFSGFESRGGVFIRSRAQ